MTNEHDDPTSVLVLRLLRAQGQIKHLTTQYDDDTSDGDWLRHMAGLRTELAGIYMLASHNHGHDTIEWHALREASLMHEMNATANLAAADHHDKTTKDGAA